MTTFLLLGGCLVLLAGVALLLPARTARIAAPSTRLDAAIPEWQFSEVHSTRIRASAAAVEAAIDAVTAGEIRGFRTLTWIRNPRLPGSRQEPSILAPPSDRPLLAVATSAGFIELSRVPGEIVVGTLVIAPTGKVPQPPPAPGVEAFAALTAPGYAKAAMNFRWTEDSDGWVRLSTSTRIVATSPGARRRFAAYWRLIYPGSAFLRRTWLAAIRRRAEAAEHLSR
ncbi:MAG: hypothetical protein KBF21_04775 [Thermoanaerobaculia bacterium]|nr:hypothetical protein [Thermoanaerobaculia bacterium]MBP9823518.1 hypothetical protein [Thermoanaerobaculia bacterium]